MALSHLLILFTCLMAASSSVYIPKQAEDIQDGAWFGTQSLLCVVSGDGLSRTRRSLSPERRTLDVAHRVIFYRGKVFEWGTGTRGYSFGSSALINECSVTWETAPALRSNCPVEHAVRFTREYRSKYGGYNLFLNNCHHFANRLMSLLVSENCQATSETDSLGRVNRFVDRATDILFRGRRLRLNPRDEDLLEESNEDESLPTIDK